MFLCYTLPINKKHSLTISIVLVFTVAVFASPSPTYASFNSSFGESASGPQVKELQQTLTNLGYYSDSITGYFGQITKAAVIQFQKENNISPVLGYVGDKTRAKLNSGASMSANAATPSSQTHATWWNPFSWFSKDTQVAQQHPQKDSGSEASLEMQRDDIAPNANDTSHTNIVSRFTGGVTQLKTSVATVLSALISTIKDALTPSANSTGGEVAQNTITAVAVSEDNNYILSLDGKKYTIVIGQKNGIKVRSFLDNKGVPIRDINIAQKIAEAAWAYENIITDPNISSSNFSSGNVRVYIDVNKEIRKYEASQDLLARVSVEAIAAVISGGTTLPKAAFSIPKEVVMNQLKDPYAHLALVGRIGLGLAEKKYEDMEDMIRSIKSSGQIMNAENAIQVRELYLQARPLELKFGALLNFLNPKNGQYLVMKYINSARDQALNIVPAWNEVEVAKSALYLAQGLDELIEKIQAPGYDKYMDGIKMATSEKMRSDKQISTWANAAIGVATNSLPIPTPSPPDPLAPAPPAPTPTPPPYQEPQPFQEVGPWPPSGPAQERGGDDQRRAQAAAEEALKKAKNDEEQRIAEEARKKAEQAQIVAEQEVAKQAPQPPTSTNQFDVNVDGNLTVARGKTGIKTVTANIGAWENKSVSFKVSGLPSGASGEFSPPSCDNFCNTMLTIATSPSTQLGHYEILVTGTRENMSDDASFTLTIAMETKPGTPVNLTATAVSSSQIQLKWTDTADNENVVRIERTIGTSAMANPDQPLIYNERTRNKISYLDTGLSPNTGYCYRVYVLNDEHQSDYSNVSCAATLPIVLPSSSMQTLSVSLLVSPLSVAMNQLAHLILIATVSGSAQGTINYTFYCNRSDFGTNIMSNWDAKFDGVSNNPKTANGVCHYSTPGTYTTKVIAERGSAPPAEARSLVTVVPTLSQ